MSNRMLNLIELNCRDAIELKKGLKVFIELFKKKKSIFFRLIKHIRQCLSIERNNETNNLSLQSKNE